MALAQDNHPVVSRNISYANAESSAGCRIRVMPTWIEESFQGAAAITKRQLEYLVSPVEPKSAVKGIRSTNPKNPILLRAPARRGDGNTKGLQSSRPRLRVYCERQQAI